MTFNDLNLSKQLYNALEENGFTEPTPIQTKVFSPIMAGRDVVGIAQTGTGKTFGYLLPVLRQWKFTKSPFPQILIVVPTRELVAQVVETAKMLSTYMNTQVVGVYGGTNIKVQKNLVYEGADIVVGTPGRIVDLMKDGVLKTKQLKKIIIDEVDEMLNLGFRTQLKLIYDFLPKKIQHLMFSATMTEEVEVVIKGFTKYYDKIETAPSGAPLENIDQYAYRVPNFNSKANLLENLISNKEEYQKVLVFTKSKKMANALYERLYPTYEDNIGIIHGSKDQNNRFRTVANFQDGTCTCLIATDIIARGLDVESVTHVFNYDLTDTAEKYIHRIGRTGRADKKGISISFVSEDDEAYLTQIEALMDLKLTVLPIPEGVELSEELIPLEIEVEHVPFNNNKMKQHVPSGPAFQEKLPKNQKINHKVRHADAMMKKYGKSQTRGDKFAKKKKK